MRYLHRLVFQFLDRSLERWMYREQSLPLIQHTNFSIYSTGDVALVSSLMRFSSFGNSATESTRVHRIEPTVYWFLAVYLCSRCTPHVAHKVMRDANSSFLYFALRIKPLAYSLRLQGSLASTTGNLITVFAKHCTQANFRSPWPFRCPYGNVTSA